MISDKSDINKGSMTSEEEIRPILYSKFFSFWEPVIFSVWAHTQFCCIFSCSPSVGTGRTQSSHSGGGPWLRVLGWQCFQQGWNSWGEKNNLRWDHQVQITPTQEIKIFKSETHMYIKTSFFLIVLSLSFPGWSAAGNQVDPPQWSRPRLREGVGDEGGRGTHTWSHV